MSQSRPTTLDSNQPTSQSTDAGSLGSRSCDSRSLDSRTKSVAALRCHEPRSAYLHIPFCIHRCGYCNFTVVAGREDLVDPFLDALEIELQSLGRPMPMETVFWGGGTPSLLDGPQLLRLVELTGRWLPLVPDGEWSCEANPLDLSDEKLHLLRQAGINRLSIGGQSFQDNKLRVLERDHDGQQLADAIVSAQRVMPRVALDLIFAAPGETLDAWRSDLQRALELGVRHVSTYGLTIEQGSAFFGRQLHGRLSAVDEAVELEMYQAAIELLSAAGMEHYEVSNFARAGEACRHNEAYWFGKPWLAFGPGAARFDGRTRSVNHRSLHTYLRRIHSGQSPVQESEVLTDEQILRERFVFGMRRLAGVDFGELAESDPRVDLARAQLGVQQVEAMFQPYLDRAVAAGWFERQGSRVRLTRAGLMISDSLWPDFLS